MPQFDAHELKLLKQLQLQGRRSISDLADDIGLSITPTARRFDRLIADGVIKSFAAQLDRRAIGLQIEVFVGVSLTSHTGGVPETFTETVRNMPAITACWSLTGDKDFLLHVVVPNIDALDHFVMGTLLKIPGVRDVTTNVVLNNIKGPTPLPLGHLTGR